jgi:protein gp37
MQKTNISYLTHTWNPIAMRCTPCSPGCEHCWHLRMAARLCKNPMIPEDERKALAGEGPFVLREREFDTLKKLKKPSVIGVQFMGDLFHEDVPDEWIEKVYSVIHQEGQHTFVTLTKRPDRGLRWYYRPISECTHTIIGAMQRFRFNNSFQLDNLYLGVTVCNQPEADEKIFLLRQIPAEHRWVSLEPLLGPVRLPGILDGCTHARAPFSCESYCSIPGPCHLRLTGESPFDLVVLGAETGPKARPMHPGWVQQVRDGCQASGVPFYFKGWGEWEPCTIYPRPPGAWSYSPKHPLLFVDTITGETRKQHIKPIPDGHFPMQHVGRRHSGRLLDGRTYDDLVWRTPA